MRTLKFPEAVEPVRAGYDAECKAWRETLAATKPAFRRYYEELAVERTGHYLTERAGGPAAPMLDRPIPGQLHRYENADLRLLLGHLRSLAA